MWADPEQKKKHDKAVVYLTRHGFREDWVNPVWRQTSTLPFDPPLAASGIQQAQELANALSSAGITKIFSSPYYRCLQTANAVAESCMQMTAENVPIFAEIGVGERFNETEAKKHRQGVCDRRSLDKSLIPHLAVDYKPLATQHPWYETKEQLHERGAKMADMISKLIQEEGGTFLIVTHASTLIALTRGFLKDPSIKVKSAVCAITKLVWDPTTGRWKMKMNGSCTHLSEGEQRAYSFSDEP